MKTESSMFGRQLMNWDSTALGAIIVTLLTQQCLFIMFTESIHYDIPSIMTEYTEVKVACLFNRKNKLYEVFLSSTPKGKMTK